MKKFLSIALAIFTFCSLSACSGEENSTQNSSSSSDGGNGGGSVTTEKITLVDKKGTEYAEDYEAYPTADGVSKAESYFIDLNYSTTADIFKAAVIEGIVNRKDPELYLVSQPITSGYWDFNSPAFWLEELKADYGYSFTEIQTVEDLIVRYRAKLKGAVVYDERITSETSEINVWERAYEYYGDVAVSNLTLMACGQYDAIPVTEAELNAINALLQGKGLQPLSVLLDTRSFSSPNGVAAPSNDKTVWKNVYEFALEKIESKEWTFTDRAMMHRGSAHLEDTDYAVMSKLFTYNRIRDFHSTEAEKALETRILALTKTNTPVLGCYYASIEGEKDGYEEHTTCQLYNSIGKYWYVTYGSFNMSYTSGLEKYTMEEKSVAPTYDPNKTYVSFAFTEGDNNSYAQYRMIREFEKDIRGSFPMTWQVSQGAYDLNPNILKHIGEAATVNDGFAFGSSGIGYVYEGISCYQDFYGLSDSYCKKSGITCVEMFTENYELGTQFAEYSQAANVFVGFAGAGYEYNAGNSHNYYGDNSVFRNVFYTGAPIESLAGGGNLVNIKFHGWNNSLEDIAAYVAQLPESVVPVTQKTLVELSKQKAALDASGGGISFQANYGAEESPYLDYLSFTPTRGERVLSEGDKLVYKLPVAENQDLTVNASGDYRVLVSANRADWVAMKPTATYGASKYFSSEQTTAAAEGTAEVPTDVYVMIEANGETTVKGLIYGSENSFSKAVSLTVGQDAAFYVGAAGIDGNVRKGEVVYRIPQFTSSTKVIATVTGVGEISGEISVDGKKYYPITLNEGNGEAYSEVLVGAKFIKFTSDLGISAVKFTPLSTTDCMDFSPCNNPSDQAFAITGLQLTKKTNYTSAGIRATVGQSAIWCVPTGKDFGKVLQVSGEGEYALFASTDGKRFTRLNVQNGKADISAYVGTGKTLYLRFECTGETAELYRLRAV